jgi:hypothetical protein
VLLGLDTVSIGEPSARLADPSSGPATTAQEWGVSVIESGEFPVIVTKDADVNVLLLEHARDALNAQTDPTRITSDAFRSHLLRRGDDSPWVRWWGNDSPPAACQAIAHKLRPFDIQPRQIRMGQSQARGYLRCQFEEAWKRYSITSATPKEEAENPASVQQQFEEEVS